MAKLEKLIISCVLLVIAAVLATSLLQDVEPLQPGIRGGMKEPVGAASSSSGAGSVSTDPHSGPAASAAPSSEPQRRVHVVRPGDTLSEIAQETLGSASRWQEIASINGIDQPGHLRVGMPLVIPEFVVPKPTLPPAPGINDIDRLLKDLTKVNGFCDIPREVQWNVPFTVRAVIAPGVSLSALRVVLGEDKSNAAAEVATSPIMTALATGPGFQICQTTAETQALPLSEPTAWEWSVIGTETGAQALTVRLYALLPSANGVDQNREVHAWKGTITVTASPWNRARAWIVDHLEWCFGTLLIPLLALILRDPLKRAFRGYRSTHRQSSSSTRVGQGANGKATPALTTTLQEEVEREPEVLLAPNPPPQIAKPPTEGAGSPA